MCGIFGFVVSVCLKFFPEHPPMIEPKGVALLVILGALALFYIGAR